jgi:hypothetical protein
VVRRQALAENSQRFLLGLAASVARTLRDSSQSSRPQEILCCLLPIRGPEKNGPTAFCDTSFVIPGEWAAKMPLKEMKVNLWKSQEVS